MDFFAAQARAERHSRHIVWMFIPSVALTAVCVSLPLLFWNPIAFTTSCFVASMVIILGMLWQLNLYRGGGSAVASSVGARRIAPNTTDFRERRLLDIVEELAIAASAPVPPVYVLDDESGINAFAAGFGASDAVITVTQGALRVLSRDELQAVIGHEMSHILHSDVRLNLRLAALVSGLLLIVTLGLLISRIALQGESGVSRGSSKDNGAAILLAIMLFGLVAAAVGWVGMIVGQIMQASVCRQREFLADASSVQYTRNPGAMCSALGKIKVLPEGSMMDHHQSMNVAHMLFAGPSAHWWSELVATHPPIEQRVGAIDANYKIDAGVLIADAERQKTMAHDASPAPVPSGGTASGIDAARRMFGAWPTALRQASRDPAMAGALAAGLMMSSDTDVRARQFQALHAADPTLHDKTAALMPAIDSAGVHAVVPLANLTGAALSHLPAEDKSRLNAPLNATLQAGDGGHALPQSLYALLQARARAGAGRTPPLYVALSPVLDKVALILATLSKTVTGAENASALAFARGAAALKYPELPYPPEESSDLFINAIATLDSAAGPVKARVIDALSACINDPTARPTADTMATLHAIAAAMHCPMP